ncbi:MAG: hypothetical protein KIS87_07105 [Phycisphaeraceae bacterium]|nr:hypothetical protein [Phycisphaeraceae bacterium]
MPSPSRSSLREPIADAATLDAALEASGEWTAAERRAWQERIAPAPIIPASATAIRVALNQRRCVVEGDSAGESPVRGLISPDVCEYIRRQSLYVE